MFSVICLLLLLCAQFSGGAPGSCTSQTVTTAIPEGNCWSFATGTLFAEGNAACDISFFQADNVDIGAAPDINAERLYLDTTIAPAPKSVDQMPDVAPAPPGDDWIGYLPGEGGLKNAAVYVKDRADPNIIWKMFIGDNTQKAENGVNSKITFTYASFGQVCATTAVCNAASLGIVAGEMDIAACKLPTTADVTTCTVSCGSGYAGAAVIRKCTAANTWSLANPVCAAAPIALAGCRLHEMMGYFSATMGGTCNSVTLPGVSCSVSCLSAPTTVSTLTCTAGTSAGYWSGSAPNCGNVYAAGKCGSCSLDKCQGDASQITGKSVGSAYTVSCQCLPCNVLNGRTLLQDNSRSLRQFAGLSLVPMITVTCSPATSTACCTAAFTDMACAGVTPVACQCGATGVMACPSCQYDSKSNKALLGLLALLGLIPLCLCCLLFLVWLFFPAQKKADPIQFANFAPTAPPVVGGSFMSITPMSPTFVPPMPPPPLTPGAPCTEVGSFRHFA